MVIIINQIRHTYAYIKILFENYPELVSYFHRYFVLEPSCSFKLPAFLIQKGLGGLCTHFGFDTLYFSLGLLDRYDCVTDEPA